MHGPFNPDYACGKEGDLGAGVCAPEGSGVRACGGMHECIKKSITYFAK
jgi:hypothetical protein